MRDDLLSPREVEHLMALLRSAHHFHRTLAEEAALDLSQRAAWIAQGRVKALAGNRLAAKQVERAERAQIRALRLVARFASLRGEHPDVREPVWKRPARPCEDGIAAFAARLEMGELGGY